MDKACIRTDNLGKVGEECDDVVLDFAFDSLDPLDVEARVAAPLPDRLCCLLGDKPELGHGVGRVRLDFEPDAKPSLRRPDISHFGSSVSRDHVVPRGLQTTGHLTRLGSAANPAASWPGRLGVTDPQSAASGMIFPWFA